MLIKVSQKNQLFSILSDFESTENYTYDDHSNTIKIKKINTEFIFRMDISFGVTYPYSIFYSPAETTVSNNEYVKNWDDVIPYFVNWLQNIETESAEADLWEKQKQRPKQLMQNIIFDAPERNFTDIEKQALLSEIDKLKLLLENKASGTEQLKRIENEINEIKNALNTKTNFEWFNFLIDKSTDLGLMAAFEYRHEIMHIIKGIFELYSSLLHQLA